MSEQHPAAPENGPQPSRDFRLDEVLTVVTEVNFLDTQGDPDPNAFTRRMGDLLGYATNEKTQLERQQLPRISEEVTPHILEQYPELRALVESMPKEPSGGAHKILHQLYEKKLKSWIEDVKERYGDKMDKPVAITPIDPADHTHIDAATEFQMMGGTSIDKPEDLGAAVTNVPELPKDIFDRSAAEAQLEDMSGAPEPSQGEKTIHEMPAERREAYTRGAEAAAKAALKDVELDIPDAEPESETDVPKVANPGEGHTQRLEVGNKMERYAEAMRLAGWAEGLENGQPQVDPGPMTPLKYHMSKAIGREARQRIIDQYVNDPDSLTFPADIGW